MPSQRQRDSVFKYRQRSLDHLKRVYAIVLSVSLGELLKDIYQTLILQKDCELPPNTWIIQVILLLIFFATASVFYFQEDKLLDLRFGFDPTDIEDETPPDAAFQVAAPSGAVCAYIPPKPVEKVSWPEEWTPGGFAFHFVSVMLMMMPFVLVALSAGREQVLRFGLNRFVVFYLLLLEIGTAFAFFHSHATDRRDRQQDRFPLSLLHPPPPPSRDDSYAAVKAYQAEIMARNWLMVNGTTALAIEFSYHLTCPPGRLDATAPWAGGHFLVLFCLFATLRNIFDYLGTWPFLYLNKIEVKQTDVKLLTFSRLLRYKPEKMGWLVRPIQAPLPHFVFGASVVFFFVFGFPHLFLPSNISDTPTLPCPAGKIDQMPKPLGP